MSFFDDSPELAADLRDVFNILYPPSPTSTTQDDWEETEEEGLNRVTSDGGTMTLVDLDGPVHDLPPLHIHETHAETLDHDPTSTNKTPGYVESLMSKLSRKRIRAILDSTLPLIGRASDAQEKAVKKRKLIEVLQPGIQIPDHVQSQTSTFLPQHPRMHTPATRVMIAKRNRQRSSAINPPLTSTHPAYNPFSALSYLSRLRSFSLKTYPTKPSPLSPQACAQAGWSNEGGRDRLYCRVCQKAWRVEVPGDAFGGIRLSAQLKQKYIHLLAQQLVSAHAPSCPWRVRQCPVTIHQDLLLLNPPISSHLASSALELESCVLAKGETPSVAHFEEADFELISPLSSTEIGCLTKNLNFAAEGEGVHNESTTADPSSTSRPEHATKSTAISSTAAILAFFGWNVFRPGSPDSVEAQLGTASRSNDKTLVPDVLRCKICDRKIGLWAFRQTTQSSKDGVSSAKALDVVLEHREFCPIRTLAGDKEGQNAWWTDAAILHETPIRGSHAVERIGQQVVDNEQNPEPSMEAGRDAPMSDDDSDLGGVVAVLKTFIG